MTKPFDPSTDRYVIGLDLDGVCADFYGRMREIAAEWLDVDIEELDPNVEYGLRSWGIQSEDDYQRMHRFAVTQRSLFRTMSPIKGAAKAIRNLSIEGARIRIITHRLFIRHFHETAVKQTIQWLDTNGFRYWDLCFMRDKEAVSANLYVEDTPSNVLRLVDRGNESTKVLAFTNSTNVAVDLPGATRVNDWIEAEAVIRTHFYEWLTENGASLPPGVGQEPTWAKNI